MEIGQICKKKDKIWKFHDLLCTRQHSQKNSEKKTFVFDCYDHTIHKESTVEIFFYNSIT